MSLYFTINPPHQWVTLDNKGIQDSGTVELLSELKTTGQRCVAVVPGELVVTSEVILPVRNRNKLMAAIPYAVEDGLVNPVDDLHFTLLNVGPENRVIFSYVSRDVISGWLEQLKEAGIVVDAMLPEYLLLPQDSPASAVISFSYDGRIFLRSGPYQGAVTNLRNLSCWLDEQDQELPLIVDSKLADKFPDDLAGRISTAKIGKSLKDWLSQGLPEHNAVLLSGEFSQGTKRSNLKQYWPVIAVFALAAFIKIGSDITELIWLHKTRAGLEQETQALYQELFPGSKLLSGRVRTQTKNKIDSLQSQASGSDFSFLLVTTVVLLKTQQATVEELDYRDGRLVAVLTLNDFAHLDRVRQQLQEDPSIDVSLKQSGARGSKVQARFIITRVAT
ncbi:MAG: type II secretion system protein GspL [Arenicellales bacterium]